MLDMLDMLDVVWCHSSQSSKCPILPRASATTGAALENQGQVQSRDPRPNTCSSRDPLPSNTFSKKQKQVSDGMVNSCGRKSVPVLHSYTAPTLRMVKVLWMWGILGMLAYIDGPWAEELYRFDISVESELKQLQPCWGTAFASSSILGWKSEAQTDLRGNCSQSWTCKRSAIKSPFHHLTPWEPWTQKLEEANSCSVVTDTAWM